MGKDRLKKILGHLRFGGGSVWLNVLVIISIVANKYDLEIQGNRFDSPPEYQYYTSLSATTFLFFVFIFPLAHLPVKFASAMSIWGGKWKPIILSSFAAMFYSNIIFAFGLSLAIDALGVLWYVFPGEVGEFFRYFGGWDHLKPGTGWLTGLKAMIIYICPSVILCEAFVFYNRRKRDFPDHPKRSFINALKIGALGNYGMVFLLFD